MVHLLSAVVDAMVHLADAAPRWLGRLADHAVAIAEPQHLPGALWLLAAAVALATALVAAVALLHMAWVSWRHPVAGVFVSYHHSRAPEASAVAQALRHSGTRVTLLPFLDEVAHDALLDAVQQGIRGCDVFVCLPAQQTSFVDAEVAMAFALQKPLLLVLDPDAGARVPNLAKKGYPMFDARRLQAQGYAPLTAFVRLLAGDARSVLAGYGWAARHLARTGLLVVGVWLLCLAVLSAALDAGELLRWRARLADLPGALFDSRQDDGLLWGLVAANGVLIALPLLALAFKSAWLRARARRAVAGQRFATLPLPRRLGDGLTRAQFQQVLVHRRLSAGHEPPEAGLVVDGHTLPVHLQSPALHGWVVLLASLCALAFSAGMGWALWGLDDGWLQALMGLMLVPVAALGMLGLWFLPREWSAEARGLRLDEEGLHRHEVGWRGPPRPVTLRWRDIEGFEWLAQGPAWALAVAVDGQVAAPWWLNRRFEMDPVALMAVLQAMHARFGRAAATALAPADRGWAANG